MNYIEKREKRVRIDLVKDLIRMDMLRCKPISQQQHTRPLAVASAETRPMKTEAQ